MGTAWPRFDRPQQEEVDGLRRRRIIWDFVKHDSGVRKLFYKEAGELSLAGLRAFLPGRRFGYSLFSCLQGPDGTACGAHHFFAEFDALWGASG